MSNRTKIKVRVGFLPTVTTQLESVLVGLSVVGLTLLQFNWGF